MSKDEGGVGHGGERGSDGSTGHGRRLLPGVVRRHYAAKLLGLGLLVVLVVAGVGVASYVQIQGIIEDDAESTLRSTATLQADSIAEWRGGMHTQTRAVASGGALADSESRIRAYLDESLAVAHDEVVGLHYVRNGRVVASTNREFEDRRATEVSPAWRAPIETATAADEPGVVGTSRTAYERNGDLLMAFAAPARSGDGVVVAVGNVRQDFEQLHETRPIVRTQVFNPEGHDVFAPRQNTPSPVRDTPAFRDAVAGNTTTLERERAVLAFAPVAGLDWVVVTTAPKAQLYEAGQTVGRNVIVLVASSLAVLTVAGTLLGRSTIRPLTRLRARAREMEEGTLDVDLSTTREDEFGRLFEAFANMRDALREQIREAERARQEAERSTAELERQNERLDQFASTVSHDLRNPLTVAQGNVELLAGTLADLDDEAASEARERAETVAEAHERIEAIIEDVLALARRGETVAETEPVDLAAVARDAWDTVEHADAVLSVAGNRTLDADRGRLRRVLENLFRNSVEHAGPEVTVEVGTADDGFYVADDGPGIPPEDVEDVFEYGHTDSEDGTGLGLSIVRTLAEAHGWTVSVDEDYGDGARFVFAGVDAPAAETEDGGET